MGGNDGSLGDFWSSGTHYRIILNYLASMATWSDKLSIQPQVLFSVQQDEDHSLMGIVTCGEAKSIFDAGSHRM